MRFLLDRFPLDTFLSLLSALRDRGDEVPLYVLTHQSQPYHKNISGCCFYDRELARGSVTSAVPFILDRDDIKKASTYEGLAISVFARFSIDQKTFSAQEMSSHYYELYNFWVYQISRHKIDFCFQHYMPHDPSSFVLYIVLKISRIPVVFLDAPHIFNKYRSLSCSFEYRDLLVLGDGASSHLNIPYESAYFRSELNSQSIAAIPKAIRFRYQKKQGTFLTRLVGKCKEIGPKPKKLIITVMRVLNVTASAGHFFKISRRAWKSRRSEFSKIHFYFFMKKVLIQLLIQRKRYENRCLTSYPDKYVYFAMAAQPEGSTLPAALEFRDVFSVLRLLREAIPADVPILFKENPSVFEVRNPYLSAVSYRAPDYYQRIQEITNLKLVSVRDDSHQLIKNSLLVATINGTAAVEAIHFGVPAVTFGSNWYDTLDGIFKYRSTAQLKDLWTRLINDMPNPEPERSESLFDTSMLVDFDEHNPYEFDSRSRELLIRGYLKSIEKFGCLDDRKWTV